MTACGVTVKKYFYGLQNAFNYNLSFADLGKKRLNNVYFGG